MEQSGERCVHNCQWNFLSFIIHNDGICLNFIKKESDLFWILSFIWLKIFVF